MQAVSTAQRCTPSRRQCCSQQQRPFPPPPRAPPTSPSSARVIVPVDDTDEYEVELAGVVHCLWASMPRAVSPLEVTLSDQACNTPYHLNLLWDCTDGRFFKRL